MKSWRIRLAGDVGSIGGIKMHTKFCMGNLKVKYHLEDQNVGESIILKWI
jgi:hypothetical protein